MTASAFLQVVNELLYSFLTAAVIVEAMPGMSGRDLSRDLRRTRPDLRVVYMSGYSEELVLRDSKLDGPLLQKPFNRESLLMIVRRAIAAEVRTKGSPEPIA